jgi:protein-arginine kinase activator protein McsA
MDEIAELERQLKILEYRLKEGLPTKFHIEAYTEVSTSIRQQIRDLKKKAKKEGEKEVVSS